MRVAILEDDVPQLEIASAWIRAAGHTAHGFTTGKAFLANVRHESYDLFVIDWELPDTSGLDVLVRLRTRLTLETPVLFVTQRDGEDDVVRALRAGADDYLVKPVTQNLLRVRIAALLRRAYPESQTDRFVVPPYEFDLASRRLLVDGTAADLTDTEFNLAVALFRKPGRVLSRAHLYEQVWGTQEANTSRTLDTVISSLRRKLRLRDESELRLSPVYSFGYRLENKVAPT